MSAEHVHGSHRHGGHAHGIIDASITATTRGLWAVTWSFVVLFAHCALPVGSGDPVQQRCAPCRYHPQLRRRRDRSSAEHCLPFARRPISRRFTFGFGRVEDFAGLAVVLTIATSAIVAVYEAIHRFLHPRPCRARCSHHRALNYRFCRERGGCRLPHPGRHADRQRRADRRWLSRPHGRMDEPRRARRRRRRRLGYPLADPIIGLVITVAILGFVWGSVRLVFSRLLDGVEPEVIDQIHDIALCRWRVSSALPRCGHVGWAIGCGPRSTSRWGRSLRSKRRTAFAQAVEHQLEHHLPFLSGAIIHVDPALVAWNYRSVLFFFFFFFFFLRTH